MQVDWSGFEPATFSGVTEEEVRRFGFPETGTFVRQWMEYMYSTSDAPLAYHLGVGLTMLAPLIPEQVMLPGPDRLRPNMFTILIGTPSSSRKTFSITHAQDLLTDPGVGASQHVMGSIGSAEAITDEVIHFPRRLIAAYEGGNFLQHTIGGKYGGQVRGLLTELYDSKPVTRITVGAKAMNKLKTGNSNASAPRQDNPRVSMLLACTKANIEEFTFKSDWSGGFLSRYVILWARRERNFSKARMWPEGEAHVKARLAHFMGVHKCGPCTGMTPQAEAYFDAWQAGISSFGASKDEKTSGTVDRAQQNARKAALVLAYDRHISSGRHPEEPWQIDMQDVFIGCVLGNFSIKSALHVEQDVTDNEHGQIMNRVVNFIRNTRSGCRSLPEILRYTNRPLKMMTGYLESLVAMERVAKTTTNNERGAPIDVYFTPDGGWAAQWAATAAAGQWQPPPPPRNDDDNNGTRH